MEVPERSEAGDPAAAADAREPAEKGGTDTPDAPPPRQSLRQWWKTNPPPPRWSNRHPNRRPSVRPLGGRSIAVQCPRGGRRDCPVRNAIPPRRRRVSRSASWPNRIRLQNPPPRMCRSPQIACRRSRPPNPRGGAARQRNVARRWRAMSANPARRCCLRPARDWAKGFPVLRTVQAKPPLPAPSANPASQLRNPNRPPGCPPVDPDAQDGRNTEAIGACGVPGKQGKAGQRVGQIAC